MILRNLFVPARSIRFYTTRSVYISESKDIYTNLAIEDWIYKNVNCDKHHILMLWKNDPCVVIGRHQNPWCEANISQLKYISERGVNFARRNSGGGAVYHDEGNINLTFFTSKKEYNRRRNLEFIQKVLKREFDVEVEINKREDLVIGEYKISGTASKLGRLSSYHHCTLLIDANRQNLSNALKKSIATIKTNATQSTRSKIMNLKEINPSITIEDLFSSFKISFLLKEDISEAKENLKTDSSGVNPNISNLNTEINNVQIVQGTEKEFLGISALRNELSSWEWNFGKTPKFTISRTFPIPNEFNVETISNVGTMSNVGTKSNVGSKSNDGSKPNVEITSNVETESNINIKSKESLEPELSITMNVEEGLIKETTIAIPYTHIDDAYETIISEINQLSGTRFSEESIEYFKQTLELNLSMPKREKTNFVLECLNKVVLNT